VADESAAVNTRELLHFGVFCSEYCCQSEYLRHRERCLHCGKRALGLAEISKEKAAEILAYLPLEKSFHFYADVGKPLNVHAASLGDFCDKILKVDSSSIEFHTGRGDFEAWFTQLGDTELARKTLLIREEKMVGENLRKKLHEIVKNRCDALARMRSTSL
jgi:hypothetical protein